MGYTAWQTPGHKCCIPISKLCSSTGSTLPAIIKVLRTIKLTEDATAEPATQNMYLLCDMALALARAIEERHCPGSPPPGRFPGSVPLPKAFFRQLDRNVLKGESLWAVAPNPTCTIPEALPPF
jgi:hypothetical protein